MPPQTPATPGKGEHMKRQLLYDIAERMAWTAVQAGLASLTIGSLFGLAAWKGAAIAAGAAVLSMLKGLAASRLGVLGTAATLPAAVVATAVVAGEVVGTVVDTAGEVVGEVTGTVAGTVGDVTGTVGDLLGGGEDK